MTTYIKQERFDEFKARAFEYGYKRFANEWCKTFARCEIYVKADGEMVAVIDKKIVRDIPYDYISKLVWDGFIKKVD